jgi:hypothetical protein
MTDRRQGPGFIAILVLVAGILISAFTSACSGGHMSGSAASSATKPEQRGSPAYRRRVNDALDGDDAPLSPAYNLESDDDEEVLAYGHAAGIADARTVDDFVKRFFVVAVSGNGSTACAMIDVKVVKQIPRMGKASNSDYFRGSTCAEVMSKLLRHEHHRLMLEAAGLGVTGVRIGRGRAIALLAFRSTPERRYLRVQREGPTWKLDELLDGPFP